MTRITEITRRSIFDVLRIDGWSWCGRLEEPNFLNRLFDLRNLPSTDTRFRTALSDIHQHRIRNLDWPDDWVFEDGRLNLMHGDDEVFLRFLCETIHPVVRSEPTEVEQLLQMYNQHLAPDGFEIVERTQVSGRPIFVGRYIGVAPTPVVSTAKESLQGLDADYVTQQITRMEIAVADDPELAIGTAKELVETCCKTILKERGIEYSRGADLPELVKLTRRELEITPDAIPAGARAADTIKRLLSNLGSIAQGIAELRNQYGTGHGKEATARGLGSRHAKLAVGAASTLAVFLIETHQERSP